MRTIAKALLIIAALIGFSVLSIYAYLSSLDPGGFRDDIAQVVKQTTGRDLAIKGDISFKVFPAPKLVVEGVSLSNARWGARTNLMSADRVVAQVALVPLFSRTISIERIVLIRPVLNLEVNAKGERNWNFWDSASSSSASTSALFVDISNVDVRSGRISYLRHGAARPTVLKVQQLKLRSKGFMQPLDVRFSGRFNRRAFRINGETGSLATLFRNDPFDVNLRVSSGSGFATVKGGVKRPMELKGVRADLTLNARDLAEFINPRGGKSRDRVALTGQGRIRDKNGRYIVDKLEISFGESDLVGSVSIGRNRIKAALGSKHLNLDEVFAGNMEKRGSSRLISDDPLPVEALRAVDADVHFSGRRVILRGVRFDRLNMNANLRAGRLQLKPSSGLYGGKMESSFVLDARAATPRFSLEVSGSRVNMGNLLNALRDKRMMTGSTGQLYINLEGQGRTPRAMTASMSGRFLTSVGPGRIHNGAIKRLGADALMQLARAFDPADKSDRVTDMQCGVIRFDVKRGIARTDRGIAAETKRMNVIGSGTINFATEAIDLALKGQPREGVGLSASALGNVVRVGGTLADPSAQMDGLGALKTGASVGAAVATSGISLLVQGLFNRITADSAPCKTALNVNKKPRSPGTRPSSRSAAEAG